MGEFTSPFRLLQKVPFLGQNGQFIADFMSFINAILHDINSLPWPDPLRIGKISYVNE
jgi:hypothetical protein